VVKFTERSEDVVGIRIVKERCDGCGECVKACPESAVEIKDKMAVLDLDRCTLCTLCESECPSGAIEILKREKREVDISKYSGIMIFAEQRDNIVQPITYELLGIGQRLARSRATRLCSVLIGSKVTHEAERLVQAGSNQVYVVEHEDLRDFSAELYKHILSKIIQDVMPEVVLLGATHIGRVLAPLVAARLKTGLTADCTHLDINEQGELVQIRPAFGGNIYAEILCRTTRPQMATVRPHTFKPPVLEPDESGEVIKVDPDISACPRMTRLVEIVEEVRGGIKIDEADVVVAAGRGIGGPENLPLIEELAKAFGGAVGASRAIVDSGWISHHHQVGQTGKTVSPNLYVACGISGAVQHLVGMQTSRVIVAINRDREAPIFDIATYGIVGDLFEVIPELIKVLTTPKG
jgi:electron transfer flavoprotein alpha subunit